MCSLLKTSLRAEYMRRRVSVWFWDRTNFSVFYFDSSFTLFENRPVMVDKKKRKEKIKQKQILLFYFDSPIRHRSPFPTKLPKNGSIIVHLVRKVAAAKAPKALRTKPKKHNIRTGGPFHNFHCCASNPGDKDLEKVAADAARIRNSPSIVRPRLCRSAIFFCVARCRGENGEKSARNWRNIGKKSRRNALRDARLPVLSSA